MPFTLVGPKGLLGQSRKQLCRHNFRLDDVVKFVWMISGQIRTLTFNDDGPHPVADVTIKVSFSRDRFGNVRSLVVPQRGASELNAVDSLFC